MKITKQELKSIIKEALVEESFIDKLKTAGNRIANTMSAGFSEIRVGDFFMYDENDGSSLKSITLGSAIYKITKFKPMQDIFEFENYESGEKKSMPYQEIVDRLNNGTYNFFSLWNDGAEDRVIDAREKVKKLIKGSEYTANVSPGETLYLVGDARDVNIDLFDLIYRKSTGIAGVVQVKNISNMKLNIDRFVDESGNDITSVNDIKMGLVTGNHYFYEGSAQDGSRYRMAMYLDLL